jgi:hypothetical protein
MSLIYRDPIVRRNKIDDYTMVFIRNELLQFLLLDYGIAVPGERFDISKGHFQQFRVHLLLVDEINVPICQLLCIASFLLKVEIYCRSKLSAIVTNITIVDSVNAIRENRNILQILHAKYAARNIRKEKFAQRAINKCARIAASKSENFQMDVKDDSNLFPKSKRIKSYHHYTDSDSDVFETPPKSATLNKPFCIAGPLPKKFIQEKSDIF